MVAVYILASLVASHHSATTRSELAALPRLTLGALPPALGGEGWGGGELARMSLVACPLPVPPPQAGEGTQEPITRSPQRDGARGLGLYPRGRAIGTAAKILYCCTRGLAAAAASAKSSELFPISARG